MRTVMLFFMLTCIASASQNVVIVMDDSGSMQHALRSNRNVTRMDAAKSALVKVVSNLPADTKLGIVLLNGRWETNEWAVPLRTLNKEQTIKKIESFKPTGGTPLGGGMKAGTDVLLNLRKKEQYGTYRLLIVTDGEAGDANLVELYLPDILSRGIQVDAIGVDMSSDHSLATKVHNYRRGDDEAQLEKAIAETFAETSDKDQNAQEDFDLVAALPDEMTPKLLIALTLTPNHPVGEAPPQEEQNTNNVNPNNVPANIKVGVSISNIIFIIVGILFVVFVVKVLLDN